MSSDDVHVGQLLPCSFKVALLVLEGGHAIGIFAQNLGLDGLNVDDLVLFSDLVVAGPLADLIAQLPCCL